MRHRIYTINVCTASLPMCHLPYVYKMMAGESRFATLTSEELPAILQNAIDPLQNNPSAKRVFMTYCNLKRMDGGQHTAKNKRINCRWNSDKLLRWRKDVRFYSRSSIKFVLQRFVKKNQIWHSQLYIVLRTDDQGRIYYLNVAQYETKIIEENLCKWLWCILSKKIWDTR